MLVSFGEQDESNEDKKHHQDENDTIYDDKRYTLTEGNIIFLVINKFNLTQFNFFLNIMC